MQIIIIRIINPIQIEILKGCIRYECEFPFTEGNNWSSQGPHGYYPTCIHITIHPAPTPQRPKPLSDYLHFILVLENKKLKL